MSGLPKAIPVAACVADIHLSHEVPRGRAESRAEWYGIMDWTLEQVRDILDGLGIPLLIAGDVFHTWDEPVELVNFITPAFQSFDMPVYVVAGNHDLPDHDPRQIRRSALWGLKQSAGLTLHRPTSNRPAGLGGGRYLYPFGHGEKAVNTNMTEGTFSVALVHAYVWAKGHSFPGAPPDRHASEVQNSLSNYDVIVTGDNHKKFILPVIGDLPCLYNCGNLINRRVDERHNRPSVGIIYSDGTVRTTHLDTSQDKWREEVSGGDEPESGIDVGALSATIQELSDLTADFFKVVLEELKTVKVSVDTKEAVKRVLETVRKKGRRLE